jgi:predicted transposase/invertase (TIGR01784 family)
LASASRFGQGAGAVCANLRERAHVVDGMARAALFSMLPLLDPRIDVVFKALLQELPEAIADMIEAIVPLPGPIESLVVLDRELPHPLEKQVVLDILIEVTGLGRINVEMQRAHRTDNPSRFLLYWAREYVRGFRRGALYGDLLPVTSILWLDHVIDPEGPYHSIYRICEQTTHRVYCPNLEIHTLELPKFRKVQQTSDQRLRAPKDDRRGLRLERWSRLFTDPEAARAFLQKGDTVMEQVMAKLEYLSQDETLRVVAEKRQRDDEYYNWYTATRFGAGEAKGRREGKEEGLVLGKRDLVHALLLGKFGPLSKAQAAHLAKATVAQLDVMAVRILTAQSVLEVLG